MENILKNEEKLGLRMKGDIFMKLGNGLSREDVLKNPDRAFHNIIVNVCSNLIASWSCMGNTMAGSLPSVNGWGIRVLAVGTGPFPDPMNPPAETDTQTLLVGELARKAFASVTYVDSITFLPTADRTNVVDFTATFSAAEAVGPLVEMGLFGGSYHLDDGTGSDSLVANGGTMVNYKTFKVINKPATAELTIIWRLTF
jgi:hypothetical protein